MSEYDTALQVVNGIWKNAAGLGRSVANALQDGKINAFEVAQISFQGVMLAQSVISALGSLDTETKAKVLYVLEHGEVTI